MDESSSPVQALGKLIEVLFRQWRLILFTTLISAITAGLVSVILPKSFRASVLVASTKTASSVSFGSAITTLTEEQLLTSSAGAGLLDRNARLASYLQMVESPAVAQTVLDELGSQLEEQDRNVIELLKKVDSSILENSDSIRIDVVMNDPKLAAAVANAWGRAYVDQVNAIYSESASDKSYADIKSQVTQSKATYDAAQSAFVDFVAQNPAVALTRQISETQQTIDDLSASFSNVIATIVNQQSQSTLKVYSQQVSDIQTRLERSYSDTRRVDQLLKDAQDMREQVQDGGDGAANSNALALTLLKAQVFAANEGLGNLQIQTSPVTMTADTMAKDLDSLVTVLNNRRENIDSQVQSLTQQLVTDQSALENQGTLAGQAQQVVQTLSDFKGLEKALGVDLSTSPMEQEIRAREQTVRDLKAQLAQVGDRSRELDRARDLAWTAYKNLATKQAELGVAVQTRGSVVALSSPAAAPDKDTVSGTKNVAFATVVGAVLGVFAAYALEFWWSYKGIEPQMVGVFPRRRRRKEEHPKPAEGAP